MIRSDPSKVSEICEVPPGVNKYLWQYEHVKQFMLELNMLIVALEGICTPEVCPKMMATDMW